MFFYVIRPTSNSENVNFHVEFAAEFILGNQWVDSLLEIRAIFRLLNYTEIIRLFNVAANLAVSYVK